jgi:phosphate transport system substrate-binding protein
MRRPRSRLFHTAFLPVVACCSCDIGPSSTPGGGALVGRVASDGSSTVFPIAQAMAEEFHAVHGGVGLSVGVSGTSGGLRRLCNGDLDIANASRPILEAERRMCEEHGIQAMSFTVAVDGLSLVVNRANEFVTCLTLDELRRIWEPRSTVTLWSDVRAEFPSREVELYGPGTSSGTFDHFTAAIVGRAGSSRADYQASEDDNVLVQGVSGDRYALGYLGYAYYAENADKLKLVALDSGRGCRVPSRETIEDGTYAPLSRPLFMYVARADLKRPEVGAYVRFVLDNASELVAATGYLPLTSRHYVDEALRLDAFHGPTK